MKDIRTGTLIVLIVLITGSFGVSWYFWNHASIYKQQEQGTAEHAETMKIADVLEATEPAEKEPKTRSVAVSITWKNGVKFHEGSLTETPVITETIENISEAYVDPNRQLVLVFREEMKEGTYNEHRRHIPLESILFWDFVGKNLREPSVY